MHKGTINFLFKTGQIFQESWEMNAPSPEVAMQRLKKIATARLGLLASNARIVQLVVKGHPLERVDWPGLGGAHAFPRDVLLLRREQRPTGKKLRGVPKEIFNHTNGLTTNGTSAFAALNKVLVESSCIIVRAGKEEPIGKLEASRSTVFSHVKDKKATLRALRTLLGIDAADAFWKELKEAKR